jgi:hypothetical protein
MNENSNNNNGDSNNNPSSMFRIDVENSPII